MISKLLRAVRKKRFLSWNEYSAKIGFLDMFNFQQRCRYQSIANSKPVGRY